jgi:hypothetical protein
VAGSPAPHGRALLVARRILVDIVLPRVPVRQWVFELPYWALPASMEPCFVPTHRALARDPRRSKPGP